MGYIRGRHTSPGVYTKMTSINNVGASLYEKIKPMSTVNASIPQVFGCFSYKKSYGIGYLIVSCQEAAWFTPDDKFEVAEDHGRFEGDSIILD